MYKSFLACLFGELFPVLLSIVSLQTNMLCLCLCSSSFVGVYLVWSLLLSLLRKLSECQLIVHFDTIWNSRTFLVIGPCLSVVSHSHLTGQKAPHFETGDEWPFLLEARWEESACAKGEKYQIFVYTLFSAILSLQFIFTETTLYSD